MRHQRIRTNGNSEFPNHQIKCQLHWQGFRSATLPELADRKILASEDAVNVNN